MGRSTFAISLALCLVLGSVGSTAFAQDAQVVRRITKFGKLPGGQAKRLANDLSKRMKRAADMTGKQDNLRSAVSLALFNTPAPADQMAAAKVRLRLYAGLNVWALDNLFKPRPGVIAACTRDFGINRKQCEALVAAGGQVSLADAREQGGGNAIAAAPAAQRFGQPQQQSRFGQPQQQARFGQPQQQAFGQRPAAAPVARPVARPIGAMGAQKSAAERKAEYQARRQAYLERKKAEMEARKAKIVGNAGGERAVRGPASEAEAVAAGLPVPDEEPEGAAETAAGDDAPAKPQKKAKAALDEGFLGDLLGDPLGEK